MADERFPEAFSRELGDVSIELERVSDLADSVARSLTAAFRGAIMDGRSLRGVLGEVSRAFADIALRAALKPVGSLVSGVVESLFSGLNPALAGGSIATPSYFPVAAAGAAGAAASPLSRPHGPGAPVQVTFNVTASDARSFVASEAEVSAMLLRAVRRGTRAS